jgi:hypothetical protein
MIRDEYPLTTIIMDDYQRLKQELGDVVTIKYHQKFATIDYQEVIRAHSLQALLVS